MFNEKYSRGGEPSETQHYQKDQLVNLVDSLYQDKLDITERNRIQGELFGLISGVRSAVFLGGFSDEEKSELHAKLKQIVPDVELLRGAFVRVSAVEERINAERDFAREIGWRDGMSARQFVSLCDFSQTESRVSAINAFVLGFPESAIRTYQENATIVSNASVPDVMLLNPDGGWDAQDKKVVTRLAQARSRYQERIKTEFPDYFERERQQIHEEERARLSEQDGLRRIYTTYFGLNQYNADRWVCRQSYTIISNTGLPVSTFMVDGVRGSKEPDVHKLEALVMEKSREFGV